MNIKLPQEQQKWLEAEVAQAGLHRAALAATVADLMAAEDRDFAWAKPYVDEARVAIAQGEQVTLDEFRSETARRWRTRRIINSRRHLGKARGDFREIIAYLTHTGPLIAKRYART